MSTPYNSSHESTNSFTDQAAQINLAAATVATYTVPGLNQMRFQCIFSWSANADVYVGVNETPVASTMGMITNSSGVAFRPLKKFVKGGDILSFLSTSAVADSGLELFLLSG